MRETKIAYQLSGEGCNTIGCYMGEVILDSSDIDKVTGEWVLPGGCVEIPPPENREGFHRKWTKEGWIYENYRYFISGT